MSWTISNIDELSAWLIHPRFINELSWPSSNWISFFILLGRALKNAKYRDIAEGSLKILTPDENTMREHEEEIEEDRYSGFPVLVSVRHYFIDELECLHSILEILFDDLSASGLESAYDILVSAVALSIVYQYLVGYVDKGGTKTFNPGSLEFRATYVSLLLFQGAYVWIKFRDVAKRTVSVRHKVDGSGNRVPIGRWLPLFKPHREKDRVTGKSLQFDNLRLGGYDTHQDAKVVCQIAGFYYGRDEGRVELEDGFRYDIPPMSEQERGLSGMQKWNRVSDKAKEVFRLFTQAHGNYWRELVSVFADDVVQTEQGAGDVNDLHDPTVPQLLSDVAEYLEAASSSGIEVAQIGSDAADYGFQVPETISSPEIQNAKLASTPNIAASAANAIVGNPQPLFDVRMPIPDETRSSGGTVEAGLVCGINDLGDGQDDGRARDNVVQLQQGYVDDLHQPTVSQPPSSDVAELLEELLNPTTTQAQPTWDGIEFPDISDEAVRLPESPEDEGTILDYTTTLWNHYPGIYGQF